MSYKCPQCPKRFKSKSGLRRHKIAQHPFDPPIADKATPHEEPVADVQDADDLMAKRDVIQDAAPPDLDFADVQLPHGDGKDDAAALKAALKALAIKRANVMAYRVYPDKVVIIEGPVGWKRVWRPEEE